MMQEADRHRGKLAILSLRTLASLGLCGALLTACGAGTAGIVAGTGGSGSSNSAPSIANLALPVSRTSPAVIHLELADREGERVSLELFLRVPLPLPGSGLGPPQPLTHVSGSGFPQNGATIAIPGGRVLSLDLEWRFSEEDFLPNDGRLVEGIQLLARLGGSAELVLGDDEPLSIGNDAPEVSAVTPVVDPDEGQVSGIVRVEVTIADSSADVVSALPQYDLQGDEPDTGWQLATGFGLSGVRVTREGIRLDFFWDTQADIEHLEREVVLRFTPSDGFDTGEPASSASFAVDNNAAPIGVLADGLLALDPDTTRGIAIPFTIKDEESDPVAVVFQWRREDQEFADLPRTVAGMDALLADPAQRRQRQICTEMPLFHGGRVLPPPSASALDPATHVTLPELASTASILLAGRVQGRTLEILRASQVPERVALSGPALPLTHPVAVLPVGSGPSALVLDAPSGCSWRLCEIDLANGRVLAGPATGCGDPTAMDYEPGQRSVVVAAELGDLWRVARVDLASYSKTELFAAGDPGDETDETGGIRGITCLGTGASLITVGSSLVRLDYPLPAIPAEDQAAPRAVELWEDLSTPWGIALDPLEVNRIYIAERDRDGIGRVSTLELDTYRWTEVFVQADTPVGHGLQHPTGLALEQFGARLLVLTDGEAGSRALRSVNIGGREAGRVSEIAGGFDPDAGGLTAGAGGLRFLALPGADDIAAGGGVLQRRAVQEHQPLTHTVRVDPPFDPPPRPNELWRMSSGLGLAPTSPEGRSSVFVWDSARDVPHDDVLLRVIPLDSDVGLADEALAKKEVRTFEEPTLLGDLGGWNDIALADLNADGRWDLVSSSGTTPQVPSPLNLYFAGDDGRFAELPDRRLLDPRALAPQAIGAADLDGDGDVDVAAGNAPQGIPLGRGCILIFLQPEGELGFVDVQNADLCIGSASADVDHAIGLEFADLDRDGDLDLVATNSRLQGGAVNRLTIFYQPDSGGYFNDVPPDEVLRPLAGSSGTALPAEAADLDEDGRIDLVSYNTLDDFLGPLPQTRTTTIFFQKAAAPQSGGPRFPPEQEPVLLGATPVRAVGVEVADLDEDGRQDLAWSIEGGLAIHLQEPELYGAFPDSPDSLLLDPRLGGFRDPLAADIDRDGVIDLVAPNLDADSLALFLLGQDQDPRADVVLGGLGTLNPLRPNSADLDGDGRLDLASILSTFQPREAVVFYQEGPGGYDETPELELGTPATTDRPRDLVAGDFNGDGLQDLISANGNGPGLSDPDVISDNVTVFFQRPGGRFSSAPDVIFGGPAYTQAPQSVVAADLDGDGRLDIATPNARGNSLTLYFQSSGGLVSAEQPDLEIVSPALVSPRGLIAADLDGDGLLDLASANAASGNGTIFFQDDTGAFDPDPALLGDVSSVSRPVAIAAADLDEDGSIDVVLSEQSGRLVLFHQPVDGFRPGPEPVAPDLNLELGFLSGASVQRCIVAADLNGDGQLDLSENVPRGSLAVWLQPPGRFIQGELPDSLVGAGAGVLLQPIDLVAADLDQDGTLDLASANFQSETVTVFRQRSVRVFSPTPDTILRGSFTGERPAALLAADLNGDGESDLASGLHRPIVSGFEGVSDVIAIYFGGK